MKSYLKPFFYFFYVQKFFKTKKIYNLFALYTLVTITEMMNIGLILPFLNLIFNPDSISEKSNFIFNFNDFFFDKNSKYILILLIILLFIIKSIILVIAAKYQANFFAMMRTKITTYFFDLYISKPYIYFLNEKESSKIIRNVTMLSSSYSGFLERFLLLANDFFISVGVIIILFIYDPIVSSIVFLTIFFASFLLTMITKKYFYRLGQSLLLLSSDLIKDIEEALDNILQIKLLKKTNFFKKNFDHKATSNNNKVGMLSFLQSIPKIFIEMIAVLLLFSVISYLIYSERSQEEILIMLTLFAVAVMRIIPVSNKLVSFLNSFSAFLPSLELLYTELNKGKIKNNDYSKDNVLKIDDLNTINIKDIVFGYGDRKDLIFEKVNITFNKGNIYGLVGETGSGKTTILNIITGLIKPLAGTVKYNNLEIDDRIDRKISYVSQSTYLQNSTIKNNIAFGCHENEIDTNKINSCLESAKLGLLIKNLPDGIETKISELGANFSGGQIQRLSIARALYTDSNLIIFDEPTSSLDESTKNEILNTISRLKKNRIIIMITHSKTDLNICDKIFKIENRKVTTLDNEK
jgi:ATP-binding cassette, subfamily B, bacterial PglK